MKLYDFPYAETAFFLGIKLLIALTGDPFLAGNLFYLATFVTAAWAALFVLRAFGVAEQVAVAASLLFAFLPYHFWRGPFHPRLSNYFAIPLATLVALGSAPVIRYSAGAMRTADSGGPDHGGGRRPHWPRAF